MYRLRKREGRKVEVSYDGGPWKSTGYDTIEEADDKLRWGKLDFFGDYAKDFYIRRDENSIWYTNSARGKTICKHVEQTKQTWVDTILIPKFGKTRIIDIKARDIEKWLFSIKKPDGNNYAPISKNHMLSTLREILDHAMRDGVIIANEARKVKPFMKTAKKRNFLTAKEIEIIFPKDDAELIELYGSVVMACYFRIFLDTGFRPCEIMGLRFSDIRSDGSVYTESTFNYHEHRLVHRIKTTNHGKDYKVGLLSAQSLRLVSMLHGEYIILDNIPYDKHHRIGMKFKEVVKNKLGRTDVSQYCIRHAFATRMIMKYPRELVMELMGHTTWEDCYDVRTSDQIIDTVRTGLSRYQA